MGIGIGGHIGPFYAYKSLTGGKRRRTRRATPPLKPTGTIIAGCILITLFTLIFSQGGWELGLIGFCTSVIVSVVQLAKSVTYHQPGQ
jgi:hypothetical protein